MDFLGRAPPQTPLDKIAWILTISKIVGDVFELLIVSDVYDIPCYCLRNYKRMIINYCSGPREFFDMMYLT